MTYKVPLRLLLILRSHVVVDKTNVGVVQDRVVVAYVYEKT